MSPWREGDSLMPLLCFPAAMQTKSFSCNATAVYAYRDRNESEPTWIHQRILVNRAASSMPHCWLTVISIISFIIFLRF